MFTALERERERERERDVVWLIVKYCVLSIVLQRERERERENLYMV